MTPTLFRGGTIWTGTTDTDALLIGDGVVQATGDQAVECSAGAHRVDLAGGFVMASFADGHAHPVFGGLEGLGPLVRVCGSVDEIVAAVAAYAAENPDQDWIFGASYDSSLVPGGRFDARWLDAAVPDRPVLLRAWNYHTAWCNTEALRRAGITADTADPPLGVIARRPDGTALGTLREWGAVDLVLNAAPPRDRQVRLAALRAATDYYLAAGVTWVQDAWVESDDVELYLEAVQRDLLRMRFNLALYADPRCFDEQLEGFARDHRRVAESGSALLTANTVKFFADGVIGNETAALLAPYCTGLHSHGLRTWAGESLAEAARRVDDLGLQIHIHAIGDAAVRQALDAIEYVLRHNGTRDRRPVIAHCQLIDDADLARFAELGAISNMQPLWAQLDPVLTLPSIPPIGTDRGDRQYPMRTLLDSGAILAFGSDWPVSSGAPLDGIAVAVTRCTTDGYPQGGWMPAEKMTIEQALLAYTGSVAYQAFAEHDWGRLAPGASADLVWLDRDPRTLPAQELAALRVRATYLGGEPVYRSAADSSGGNRSATTG